MSKIISKLLLFIVLAIGAYPCFSQVTITMEERGNVFYIPGKVNGLSLEFIFDTGASNVCLSLAEALFMLKNGYLSENDLKGTGYSQIANGDIVENTTVTLREVEIGGIKLHNVDAVIVQNINAPLLLGQSAIQQLGPIQLKGNQLTIANGANFQSDNTSKKLYHQALLQVTNKDYTSAINTSLDGLKYAQNNALRSRLYDLLGTSYFSLGETDKGIDFLKQAVSEDIQNIEALYNLSVFYYEVQQWQNALWTFQQVVNHTNTDYKSYSYAYLGDIQSKLKQYKDAEENYLKSIDIQPSSHAYLGLADLYVNNQQFSDAAEYYIKGIEFEPERPSNIKRYFQLGMTFVNIEDPSKAYDAFKKCINLVVSLHKEIDTMLNATDEELKNTAMEWTYLSLTAELWLARTSSSPAESIKLYTERILNNSLLHNTITPFDYINLADCYSSEENNDEEHRTIDLGLNQFKDNPELLFRKSLVLPYGSKEKMDILQKLLSIEHKYRPINFDYGIVYNNIAWDYCCQQSYNDGLSYALKAVKKNPEHSFSWETLGEIYFNLEKYQDCVNAMTKCISCDGANISTLKSAYLFRGKSLIELGKKKDGKADIKKASQL